MTSTEEPDEFQQKLFLTAVSRNDLETVRNTLAYASVDVNSLMDNGRTPLVEAIVKQDIELVSLLLEHSADPLKPCPNKVQASWSEKVPDMPSLFPLQQALKGMNGTIVCKLLDAGADLYESGFSVIEVMQLAIKHLENPGDVIKLLLSKLEGDSVSISKYKNQLSTLLVTAVTKQNVDLARIFLNKGANPNHRLQGNDIPVLVLAANEGNLEVCQALVESGAVLNNLSYIEDVRPLTSAVEAGFTTAVSTLIKLGAEVNVCSHLHVQKVSLLHIAVARKNFAVVKLLLDAGAHIKPMGNQQVTPLHIVCQDSSDTESLTSLLLSKVEHGDPILDVKNTRGQSALLLACQNKCIECARRLVEHGADANTIDGNGESVLLHAVRSGSDICVQMLIQGGAQVNSGRCIGCTPLLSAIWLGDFTLVELLIEAGADVLATKEGNHELGLHLAIAAQSEDILELLLETKKLNVDGRTDSGDTPLMLAARSSSERACQLLTEHGAQLDLIDHNQEETALSLSVYFGKEDNACWLIKEGADPNIADHSGLTPLYWAVFNCRVKVLTVLLLVGASLTLRQLNAYPRNLRLMHNEPLIDWITTFLKTPRKLQDLCRLKIRKVLRGVISGIRITGGISQLPLPDRLREYLVYQRLDEIPDFVEVPKNSDGVTLDQD